MTRGHTVHPRLLWKWQGVACYVPWAHIPVGRGSVVADLVGGGGDLIPQCGHGERDSGVCGGPGGTRARAAWPLLLPLPQPQLSPAVWPQARSRLSRSQGVWWQPVVEPAYIGQAVSEATQCIGNGSACGSQSLKKQRGHEPSAVLRPSRPEQLCHALHLLPAPASPAAYAMGFSLLSPPGGPPGR